MLEGETFEKIEKDIDVRMSHYTETGQPTQEEVVIAWLVRKVNRLSKLLEEKGK